MKNNYQISKGCGNAFTDNDKTRIWLKISEQVRTNPTKQNKENRALNFKIVCPKKNKIEKFLINLN